VSLIDDQVRWNRHGGPFPTSLVASSKPVCGVVEPVRAPELSEAFTAFALPPPAVKASSDVPRGVSMQLDIRFGRGRWFWRLAVKATVRFLSPSAGYVRGDAQAIDRLSRRGCHQPPAVGSGDHCKAREQARSECQ
jgi:hypothetical protein